MIYLKIYEKYKDSDIDDILNQISYFLKSNIRNIWIGNDSISIYIRKSKRGFEEILPNLSGNFYKIKNNK